MYAGTAVKSVTFDDTKIETLAEVDRLLEEYKEEINDNAERMLCWYLDGAVSTGTSQGRTFNDFPFDILPLEIRLHTDTGPAGSALIIDINDDGTTIFDTRAEIDDGSTEQDGNHDFVGTEILKGSDITLDVDQIGSGTAGSDLTACLYGRA